MKIFGIMRIKNEARWIAKVIESQLPAVERLLILDDHSDDATPEICESFPKVTLFRSPFVGIREDRDKNFLLDQLWQIAAAGDWIVHCDGDEEIAPGGCDEIRRLAESDSGTGPDAYSFQVLYLWDRPDQIRVDGLYRGFYRPSFFRLHQGRRFQSHAGGGFHCGNAPSPRNVIHSGVRLLHYGYMHKEDRLRKFEWYNAPDKQPVPPVEDGYRHMILGDLLPATERTRWAGPLELQTL